MSEIEERDFQAALERALNAPLRQTRVRRINSGDALITNPDGSMRRFRGAVAGTGDLVGYVSPDGLHLEVEAKTRRGKPNKAQRNRHAALERAGAIHVFVFAELDDLDLSVRVAVMRIDDAIREARALHFIRRASAEPLKGSYEDAALGAVLGAIETDLLKIAFIDDGRIYDDNLKPEALVDAYSKAKRDEERKREQVTQSRANYTAKQALRTEAIQGPKPKPKAAAKKVRAKKAEPPPEQPKAASTFTPAYEKAQGEARVRRKEKLESEAAKKANAAIQRRRPL